MPHNTSHLLLCATHRTGSNLLEQHLRATCVAGHSREYYSPELARLLAKKEDLPHPDACFLAYHRAIVDRWRSENGVFATKIMWRHLESIHSRMAATPESTPLLGATPWQTLTALHPSPMVVHITRRDKIRQAISMVRAKQSGVYSTVHLDHGRIQSTAPSDYDYHALLRHVEKFNRQDAAWVALFKEHSVPVQTVVFEEYIQNPKENTLALLDALHLPHPTEWQWSSMPARSQSDATSAEWYSRFLEDDKHRDERVSALREKKHRSRKALEKQTARTARWLRWETHATGRLLIRMEKLIAPTGISAAF